MSTELTPQVPTMATLTCNWKESTYTSTKPQVKIFFFFFPEQIVFYTKKVYYSWIIKMSKQIKFWNNIPPNAINTDYNMGKSEIDLFIFPPIFFKFLVVFPYFLIYINIFPVKYFFRFESPERVLLKIYQQNNEWVLIWSLSLKICLFPAATICRLFVYI